MAHKVVEFFLGFFCCFLPLQVCIHHYQRVYSVCDSLLIGGTEGGKKIQKTIGMCVHMDPHGSDPGGMCQLTQNQTPEANVCIKRTSR